MPHTVDTCRCGASLPPAGTSAVATQPPASKTPALIAALVGAVVLGAAGAWMVMRPAPSSATSTTDTAAASESAEPAAPADAGVSPAARAWNASASAKEAPVAQSAGAPRDPKTPQAPEGSIEEMVDRVMPAVVLVETTAGRGSAFFVSADTLFTNVHVVQNDGYVTLRRMDGSTMSARVINRAPAYDVAILKVAQPSPSQPVIPMASSQALKPGQEIVVIGSALGTLQNSVSRGIVSGLRNSGGATLVQTDAAVNPGNSGGPMLDRTGAVVGITTMKYSDAEGLNFGVAIDHARDLLEGRLADLGTQSGLSNIQSQTRQSEADRQAVRGDQQFRAQVGELAKAAATVDGTWKQYRTQCYTSAIRGSYDHEWFAILVPGAMPADAGTGCPAYYSAMESQIKQFRDLMREALTGARRANVIPGTIRDVLRTSRLDFEWQ